MPESGPHLSKHANYSALSLLEVKGESSDYKLQNVSPFFTDPKKEYEEIFERKLQSLNGKTSEDQLCIEEYLVKSEKTWFGKLRAAEMGKSPIASPAPSVFRMDRGKERAPSIFDESEVGPMAPESVTPENPFTDEFMLGQDYKPPTGLKHILRLKIGDWPLYSVLLAFVSGVISLSSIPQESNLTDCFVFTRAKSLLLILIKSPSLPVPLARAHQSSTS